MGGTFFGGQSDRELIPWIVANSTRLNDPHLNDRFTNTPAIVDTLPGIANHLGLDMPHDIRSQLAGESFVD